MRVVLLCAVALVVLVLAQLLRAGGDGERNPVDRSIVESGRIQTEREEKPSSDDLAPRAARTEARARADVPAQRWRLVVRSTMAPNLAEIQVQDVLDGAVYSIQPDGTIDGLAPATPVGLERRFTVPGYRTISAHALKGGGGVVHVAPTCSVTIRAPGLGRFAVQLRGLESDETPGGPDEVSYSEDGLVRVSALPGRYRCWVAAPGTPWHLVNGVGPRAFLVELAPGLERDVELPSSTVIDRPLQRINGSPVLESDLVGRELGRGQPRWWSAGFEAGGNAVSAGQIRAAKQPEESSEDLPAFTPLLTHLRVEGDESTPGTALLSPDGWVYADGSDFERVSIDISALGAQFVSGDVSELMSPLVRAITQAEFGDGQIEQVLAAPGLRLEFEDDAGDVELRLQLNAVAPGEFSLANVVARRTLSISTDVLHGLEGRLVLTSSNSSCEIVTEIDLARLGRGTPLPPVFVANGSSSVSVTLLAGVVQPGTVVLPGTRPRVEMDKREVRIADLAWGCASVMSTTQEGEPAAFATLVCSSTKSGSVHRVVTSEAGVVRFVGPPGDTVFVDGPWVDVPNAVKLVLEPAAGIGESSPTAAIRVGGTQVEFRMGGDASYRSSVREDDFRVAAIYREQVGKTEFAPRPLWTRMFLPGDTFVVSEIPDGNYVLTVGRISDPVRLHSMRTLVADERQPMLKVDI